MKEITKRTLAGLLCGAMLASFAGCTGDTTTDGTGSGTNSTSEGTVQTTTTPPATEDPSSSTLFTDEQLAKFAELAVKYDERAGVIADVTKKWYVMTEKNGDISLARYFTPLSKRPSRSEVSSVWHYGAFMSMASHLIAIADTEEERTDAVALYDNLVNSLAYYKGTASVITYQGTSRVTFYGVDRSSTKNNANVAGIAAVYDDQMWLVMDLMDAYEYTGNEAYMKEAVRLADICLDGWDVGVDANGKEYGGICWGPGYQTKHTCSNAPLISPLVDISMAYAAKGDSEKAQYYLEWADKIYTWVNTHLTNSQGVFGDLLGSDRKQEGNKYVTTSQSTSIDQTAYTYNSGTMLSGAAALYLATGDTKYLTQAEKLAKNCKRAFCNTRGEADNYPLNSQTVWFNFILFQGYVDLANAELVRAVEIGDLSKFNTCLTYVESMQNSIDYAYDNHLKDGFLPRDFVNGWDEKNEYDKNKNIMDQASAAETFALLSMFYEGLIEVQQLLNSAVEG